MRGQWSEAADQCAEVLRIDPRNATAHSLLGDIYQDQGRPRDARHWYQLALEMNPASTADRAKLARSDETLEARRQRAEWEAVIEGRAQPIATSLAVRESVQRIVALAGAAVCGIVLVMATLVTLSERTTNASGTAPLFPLRPRLQRPDYVITDTLRERELLRRLTEQTSGAVGRAVGVDLDPRSQSARLRVFLPQGSRANRMSREFRELVMREGYRMAQALYETNHALATIDVSVVTPNLRDPTAGTDLLLVGTLSVKNLVVSPDVVTAGELARFFSETNAPLWATDLAPPAP